MKRVCLLTGAGGTLGNAFCRLYADKYEISAVYRRRLPEVPTQHQRFVDPIDPVAHLPENDHPVYAVQADLAGDDDLARVVEAVLARFGRVDVLVNAAVHYGLAPILDGGRLLESLDSQLRINVMAPLKLAAMVARDFWRGREEENIEMNRNVINVSSTSGLKVYPGSGQSVYGASKAALNHLTRHMAVEFDAIGVRVNAAAPDGFPRVVATEQVAEAIVRLDEGDMTGKIVVVDKADGLLI